MTLFEDIVQEFDNNGFILTRDWLYDKYNEMNQSLFSGRLGECDLGIFTTGKGANGRTLGWFSMKRNGLMFNKTTRRLFIKGYWGDKEYITRQNFYEAACPSITLNGNYTWSEKAALSTLVHEMCHYYTYMYGIAPKQAHGPEFREIAYIVSSKSNGIFTVQRLASAEQMGEMQLDAAIQAKNDERKERKMSKTIPMFIYYNDGKIGLTMANSQKVVDYIVHYEYKNSSTNGAIKINICTDEKLKDFLVNDKGYKKTQTSYRYWNITGKSWLNELDKYPMKTIFSRE